MTLKETNHSRIQASGSLGTLNGPAQKAANYGSQASSSHGHFCFVHGHFQAAVFFGVTTKEAAWAVTPGIFTTWLFREKMFDPWSSLILLQFQHEIAMQLI